MIAKPDYIEQLLRDSAARLRAQYATPLLLRLREAVGLRDLGKQVAIARTAPTQAPLPTFKQYREADGKFYFKLVDGDRVLLQSVGHESARTAGQLIGRLKQEGGAALHQAETTAVKFGEDLIGHLHEGVELAEIVEALAQFAAEDA